MSPVRLHPPAHDAPPATAVEEGATAPDGTAIEVQRNYGKPSTAAEIAKALREQRKGRKAKSPSAPRQAPGASDATEAAGLPAAPEATPTAREPSEAAATAGPEPGTEGAADRAPRPKPLTPAQLRARRESHARFAGMKPMHVVEAALFSAGKPLLVEEMAETTGLSTEAIKAGVRELQAAYEERDTVLEVGKAGAKWAMQVRSRAAEPAAKFAPMEIPHKVLKTLALIAYHQPMKQSELVDMIGTKVYDHVPELTSRGLVRAREEGVTKILTTTAAFPEYFGLDAEDQESVRGTLARLVGLPPPPPKAARETMVYEEAAPEAPAAADGPAAASPQGASEPAQPAPETKAVAAPNSADAAPAEGADEPRTES